MAVVIVAYAVGSVSLVVATVVINFAKLAEGSLELGVILGVLSYSLFAYIVALPFNLACVGICLPLGRKFVPRNSERASIGLCVILGILAALVATFVFDSTLHYFISGKTPSLGRIFSRKEDLAWFFCFFGPTSVAFCTGWWWVSSRDAS